jgi:hypothetical protein
MADKFKRLFETIEEQKAEEVDMRIFEDEKVRIEMCHEPVIFSQKNIPRTPDELLDSELSYEEKELLKFLEFSPEKYYRLSQFTLQDKEIGTQLNITDEFPEMNIFVLKGGKEINDCYKSLLGSNIRLSMVPNCPVGIIIMLHEIGHTKDSHLEPIDILSIKTQDQLNSMTLKAEAFAWDYTIKKISPYLNALDTSKNDLNSFIREGIGTYVKIIKKIGWPERNKKQKNSET